MVLAYALLFLCLVFWLAAISDCLRHRDELSPVLGSKRTAFGLWMLLFLAGNPIFVVLYALFGRSAWALSWKPWNRQGAVLLTALLGVTLQFGNLGSRDAATDVKLNPLPPLSGFSAQVSTLHQGYNWATHSDSERTRAPRTVRVTYSDDEFAWLCARRVAQSLAAEGWTESVELWPSEHLAAKGSLAPELYVSISGPSKRLWPTPFAQNFQGTLHVSVASAPYPMGAHSSVDGLPSLGRREFKGEIEFDYFRFGFAFGAPVFDSPARNVAVSITSKINDAFRKPVSSDPPPPEIPVALIPEPPPDLPEALRALRPEVRGWEHAPFVHSRAYYRFYDDRQFAEVLVELSIAMEAEGWGRAVSRNGAQDERALRVFTGETLLTIGQFPPTKWQAAEKWVNGESITLPPGPTSTAPFVITHETRFDTEDYERLARQYLEEPVEQNGLRMIRGKLKSEELLLEVAAILDEDPVQDSRDGSEGSNTTMPPSDV